MKRIILTVLLMMAAASATHAENAVITRAIDGFVKPAYGDFAATTAKLSKSVDALCARPEEASLKAAQVSFVDGVKAWSRVETIRFGPVTEQNRLERILFWPDRKGIGLKQVQAALASEDADAIDPSKLAQKSVAMQGLGALEFVLFGTDAEKLATAEGAYRCKYGAAIAANLATMAGDISDGWQKPDGIAQQWANPGPDNPLYRNDTETMNELFDIVVQGLEMTRDVRINGFLGKEASQDKPKSAVFWRSGATIASIAGDLDGLGSLLKAADLKPVLGPDDSLLAQSVDAQFANAGMTLAKADGPVAELLADPAKRGLLDHARFITSTLSEVVGVRLSGVLGLTAGFSSLDGD
jgi:uncharacterized protein